MHHHAYVLGKLKEYLNEDELVAHVQHIGVSWYTYRRNIIGLENKYTRDTGWGCTIRSTQMFLSYLLSLENIANTNIIQCIIDLPLAPFGIQSFLENNRSKPPGTWWGPFECISAVTAIIKQHQMKIPKTVLSLLTIVLCDSQTIYIEDIYKELNETRKRYRSDENDTISNEYCSPILSIDSITDSSRTVDTSSSSSTLSSSFLDTATPIPWISSVNVFIPLRLGIGQYVDVEQFSDQIYNFFQLPFFIGAIGGKPNHSLFLFGIKKLPISTTFASFSSLSTSSITSTSSNSNTTNSTLSSSSMELLGLDPHHEQPIPSMILDQLSYQTYVDSLRVKKLCHVKLNKLDSSLVVGLRLTSNEDVKTLWTLLRSEKKYPIQISQKRSTGINLMSQETGVIESDWNVIDIQPNKE